MKRLSDSDMAQAAASIKHAKLVETSRKLARIVRHVDPGPDVIAERIRLESDISAWMLRFGGEAFDRPWSDDHKRVLKKLETAIMDGGMFAMAMPRGQGKSTIVKWAVLYALLTGRRKYVVVIAATAELSQAIIDFCRQQITESDLLHGFYPHVTTYARATDGKAIKAKYQLRADGKTSGIQWSKTTLILPEVVSAKRESYPSNGAILEGHGLTGAIRGKWKDTKTGKVMRPDFAILDDPQDRSSAESPTQSDMRERIITGDVLGLAGPRKRIAAVMPCTIIRKGDLADRMLDHKAHPEWQGETCCLVLKWPEAQEALWREYEKIYREETSEGRGFGAATEYYKAHRKAMDKGAVLSWEHRIRDGEISALQTAENMMIEMGAQFWAEMQNDPKDELNEIAPYNLTPSIIMSRTDKKRKAWELPTWSTRVIASTDINPSYAMTSSLVSFGDDQSAAVAWYGLHKMSIPDDVSTVEFGRQLFERLVAHGKELASGKVKPEAWGIDAGGAQFDTVTRFCAESGRLCGLTAYACTGRGAKNYRPWGKTMVGNPREQCHECMVKKDGRKLVWVAWNADYWKEVAQRAWLGEIGSPGCASLYVGHHEEFATQVCADKLIGKGEVGGEMFWNFHKLPGKNNFGDAMAQAYALCAFLGIGTTGKVSVGTGRKKYRASDFKR